MYREVDVSRFQKAVAQNVILRIALFILDKLMATLLVMSFITPLAVIAIFLQDTAGLEVYAAAFLWLLMWPLLIFMRKDEYGIGDMVSLVLLWLSIFSVAGYFFGKLKFKYKNFFSLKFLAYPVYIVSYLALFAITPLLETGEDVSKSSLYAVWSFMLVFGLGLIAVLLLIKSITEKLRAFSIGKEAKGS